jgi:hypothetical protein
VEDGPGQDQVPVQFGIDGKGRQGVAGHEPGVLQETAQVRVVIAQGRGADQELLPVELQELEDQILKGQPDLGFGQFPQLLPQGLAVVGGGLDEQFGIEGGEVSSAGTDALFGFQIFDFYLEFFLVGVHLALDPHEISDRKRARVFLEDVVPDRGLDGAALIAQDQGEVGLAGFIGAALGLAHQEELLHRVAFLQVGNQLMGHRSSLWR